MGSLDLSLTHTRTRTRTHTHIYAYIWTAEILHRTPDYTDNTDIWWWNAVGATSEPAATPTRQKLRLNTPELSSSLRIFSLTSSSHCCRTCSASSLEQFSSLMLSIANSLSPGSKVPVLKTPGPKRTVWTVRGEINTHVCLVIRPAEIFSCTWLSLRWNETCGPCCPSWCQKWWGVLLVSYWL